MKKDLKTMLISGIASLLTATILFASGGSIIIITILGGAGICFVPGAISLNNLKQDELRKKYPKEISQKINYDTTKNNFICTDKQSELYGKEIYLEQNKKYEFKNKTNHSLDETYTDEQDLIYELTTTPAISQEENINKLVRKRKKETKEKIYPNNI